MRETRAMRDVSSVTVKRVVRESSVAATIESIRATVERKVGRLSVIQHEWHAITADIGTVEMCADVASALRGTAARRVVNLTSTAVAIANESQQVFELRWNDQQPIGLGELHAVGSPPGEIVVTCRSGSAPARAAQESVLTPTAATPAADRRNAAARSVALLLRALALSDEQLQSPAMRSVNAIVDDAIVPRAAGAALASIDVVTAGVLRRASRPLFHDDAWELQYRTTPANFVVNSSSINATGFKPYRGGFDRFFADCVALTHDGVTAVFFEEYPYALRRGVISCATLQSNGELGPPDRVLERPYHLSYPFVFRDGEHIYMVPESSGNRTVDLYECTNFPRQWTFRKSLLEHVSATDATLHFDGTRWWMFATIGEQGAYGWDELHLFSADSLLSEWTPHPKNPVKCDAKSARPAGPLFVRDGRLIRPTQDCSESYGGAVNLCEVEVLSPTEFRERIVDRLGPAMFPGMNGLHTLTASEAIEVVDVRPVKRWRWEKGTIGTHTTNTE